MINKKYFTFFLFLLAAAVITGCSDSEETQGTIRLSITDAPLDNPDIVEVNLAVTRVDIKGSSGWEVIDSFDEPLSINLLEYRDGNSFLITEESIPAGNYGEIRLVLDIAEKEGGDAANRGTFLRYADGSTEPLFVPSGQSSGYKAKGEFEIPAGGVTGITVDFDARRAVVEAGNTDKFLLKPVTRLVEDKDVAMIHGTTTWESEYASLKVFAYPQGTYSEEEAIAEPESVEFPNAITSNSIREDGTFTLAFMDSGTYDLVVAAYNEANEFVAVISVIDGVDLSPGEIKQVEVTLE